MDKRPLTILVVEDEALIALNTKMQLEKIGYSVSNVLTGEAAVSHALNPDSRSDLVLMDVNLGSGIDGTQAAEQILNEKEIPIVFLSSHTDPKIVEKTEKITSYGYVVKSAGITVLDASIKMAFKLFYAKQQHARGEEEYRSLFNTIPIGIVHQSADGTIASVNPAAEKMLGSGLAEMIGKRPMVPSWKMIDENGNAVPDDEDPVMLAFKSGKSVGPVERSVFVPERNRYVWLRITSTPLSEPGRETSYESYTSLEDITAQKHSEKESNRWNLLVQEILDHSVDFISITDLEGRFQFASKSHDALGYAADDLIGKNAIDYVHPDDLVSLHDIFERIVNFQEQQTEDYRYRMSNGEYRWLETKGTLLTRDDGTPKQILFNTRDVTARKQADERLRQVLHEYDTVFNGTQDALFLVDVIDADTYRYIRNNRAHAEATGIPMEQLQNKTPQELVGKELGDELAANYGRCYQAGHPISYEETLDLPGGKRTWSTTLTPIFDQGEIHYLVGARRDISERNKAEKDLRQMSMILENVDSVAVLKDPTLRYLAANQAHLRLIGAQSMSEVIGKTDEELFAGNATEEQIAVFMENDRTALNLPAGQVLTAEESISAEDGSIRTFFTKKFPIYDKETETVASVATLTTEISAEKRAEEEIQHQLAEKETLLREVHHRIKNNMGQIESLLSIQADSAESAEVKAALNIAISRIRTTRTLYEKLLVGKGHEEVSMKEYLESLIESHVEVYNDNAGVTVDKNIVDFSFSAKKAIPVGIILNELFTNVFKYAFGDRAEGRVGIELEKTEKQVTLTVRDNGVGFDARVAANKSTGFGLTLTKMLAEQLDGTFTMESDNGTKSVVTFEV